MDPSALDQQLENALGEFHRARENARRAADEMRELTVTQQSPRNEVSVTVGAMGELRGLEFHGTAFRRMASAELSALILAAAAKAVESASGKLAEIGIPSVSEALATLPDNPGLDDFVGLIQAGRPNRGHR